MRDDSSNRERRKRRTAVEIERKYRCKYRGCPKSYGSEGSLNQHMKNKHTEFYQQFIENMNLGSSIMGNSKDYESQSSISKESSVKEKKRHKKEKAKKNEEDHLSTNIDKGTLKKVSKK